MFVQSQSCMTLTQVIKCRYFATRFSLNICITWKSLWYLKLRKAHAHMLHISANVIVYVKIVHCKLLTPTFSYSYYLRNKYYCMYVYLCSYVYFQTLLQKLEKLDLSFNEIEEIEHLQVFIYKGSFYTIQFCRIKCYSLVCSV